MGRKGRLAEIILHVTNFVYFFSGLGVLVVGALAIDDPDSLVDLLSYIPQIEELSKVMNVSGIALGPAIYLTVVGSLVMLLSILGVGGAFKRSKPVVVIFGLITLLMMLFNIAVVMFYAIDPYFISDTVESNMDEVREQYFEPVSFAPNGSIILPSEEHAEAWVTMQFKQSCCGVQNALEYFESREQWNSSIILPGGTPISANIPPSCCLLKTPNRVPKIASDFVDLQTCLETGDPSEDSEYINYQGCSEYVMQLVTRYNYIYPVVAAGMSGLQAIILCLTLWLVVLHSDSTGYA